MAQKRHMHKFEVEISYVGNVHDFDWFFKKRRRNVLDVCNVKEIDHTITKIQPTAAQLDLSQQRSITRKVISDCLKAAGFVLVTQDKLKTSQVDAAAIGVFRGGFNVLFSHHKPGYGFHSTDGKLGVWLGCLPWSKDSNPPTEVVELADPKSFEHLTEKFKKCLKKTLTPSSK